MRLLDFPFFFTKKNTGFESMLNTHLFLYWKLKNFLIRGTVLVTFRFDPATNLEILCRFYNMKLLLLLFLIKSDPWFSNLVNRDKLHPWKLPFNSSQYLFDWYPNLEEHLLQQTTLTLLSMSCSMVLIFSSYIRVTTMDFQLLLSAVSSLGPRDCSSSNISWV